MLEQTAGLFGLPVWLLTIVIIWSLTWKGLALWKSARKKSVVWFVLLLIINTMGLLEILYIFLFSKIDLENKQKTSRKNTKGKKKRKSSL